MGFCTQGVHSGLVGQEDKRVFMWVVDWTMETEYGAGR